MKVLCGSDFLSFEKISTEKFENMADLYNQNSVGMLESDSLVLDNMVSESRSSIPEANNFAMRHRSIDNSQETIAVNAPSNLIETRLVQEN
jgi:hypothetical protein